MTWQPEVDELARRHAFADGMGGPDSVDRQHKNGRLTVRERITTLTDAGSFREVGKLTGSATYDEQGNLTAITPAPYVMGLARIDGRPVAIGGEDFTVHGGTGGGGLRRKGGQGGFVEDLAHQYRIPLVNLIDGSGGSVKSLRRRGYAVLPGVDGFERSVELLGQVPVASAVLGTAAGGPAGRAILSHFTVMPRGTAQVFAAGPPVVARALAQKISKEELGGAQVAVDVAGTIHNAATDEADALAQIRRFLSYMPQNVWELPPDQPPHDPADRRAEDLLTIVPRRRTQPYDMRRIVELVADTGSVFEIQPTFGKAVITALARLNGHPVGFVANNPLHMGGAMDARTARKQVHFMEMCDCFHIPLVFLVDVPGFMVGLAAEEAATLREGMRVVFSAGQLRVPTMTVIIRKCYGMAGMATCNKNGMDLKLAWPSAEWGSLPLEGGVAAAFRREIEAAPDPRAFEQGLEDELRRLASPFRTAEAFAVEDIIDPRNTRPILCDFVNLGRQAAATRLGPPMRAGVQP